MHEKSRSRPELDIFTVGDISVDFFNRRAMSRIEATRDEWVDKFIENSNNCIRPVCKLIGNFTIEGDRRLTFQNSLQTVDN